MSDEQQHQQQQQQQRQQHQHQQQQHALTQLQTHNNKIGKDNSNATDSTTSTTPAGSATAGTPRKSNIHEMRNQEFVSRLMAATPPYLYSAPVGPNNFFFSDMLRSLVQARNNETARNLQLQQAALARRPRKRAWSHPHRSYYEQHLRSNNSSKEAEERQQLNGANATLGTNEKPLELTTNNKSYYHLTHKYRKIDETTTITKEINPKQQHCSGPAKIADPSEATTNTLSAADSLSETPANTPNITGGGGAVDATLQNNTPPAASLPPQDLVLPPPPPVWYPSLYPPYGIDPLHFFIDLRVSGHIYDRKKDNVSPLTSGVENGATNADTDSSNAAAAALTLPNKHRHGSAFTVPVPRSNESKAVGLHNPNDVMNLSSNSIANKFEHYAKYYDLGETKENQPFLKSNAGASYMLQHLPRLYSQFAARDLIGQHIVEQSAFNKDNKNTTENSDNADNKSEEADCDADSNDGRVSTDAVDVEIIDSIKFRNNGDGNDGDSSRYSSGDDASITQID